MEQALENKKGQFNVPYGNYKSPNYCDEDALYALYAAAATLKNAEIEIFWKHRHGKNIFPRLCRSVLKTCDQ